MWKKGGPKGGKEQVAGPEAGPQPVAGLGRTQDRNRRQSGKTQATRSKKYATFFPPTRVTVCVCVYMGGCLRFVYVCAGGSP